MYHDSFMQFRSRRETCGCDTSLEMEWDEDDLECEENEEETLDCQMYVYELHYIVINFEN